MSAIKELREKTGTGMMDCKVSDGCATLSHLAIDPTSVPRLSQAALEESGGDIDGAYEVH